MTDIYAKLNELFGGPGETLTFTPDMQKRELNGVEAANRAVAQCAPDASLIFLKKSEYHDLLNRAVLPELKFYKKKYIVVVSDDLEVDSSTGM
jgi:peptidyl-tRNA hydrolase